MIQIYNEDCEITMRERIKEHTVDVILTSPPYNNSNRTGHKQHSLEKSFSRYDKYNDNKTNQEYCDWMCNIFRLFGKILKENGTALINMSYSGTNPTCMFKFVSEICDKTNFIIADVISWRKSSWFPNVVSTNKLTRVIEYIFVFCRKDEYNTFFINKEVTTKSQNRGQNYYKSIPNFVEAKSNDGVCLINRATYSTDLCKQLLNLYAKKGEDTTVYDPFMGTGTTANACKEIGISCIGSEISKDQCDFAERRLVIGQQVYKDRDKYFRKEEEKKEKLF